MYNTLIVYYSENYRFAENKEFVKDRHIIILYFDKREN